MAIAPRNWLPASIVHAWDRASPRERRIGAIGAFVVIVGVGYALVWQPMRADIDRTREQLARDTATLELARARVNESAALSREARQQPSNDPRAAITRALTERDLRLSGRLDVQEGRVKMLLPDARFDSLLAALDALRRDEGLRVAEAVISGRVEPGTVRAEITLAR